MKHPYIISYHYTANGHCCIDGITGEYVETDDNGEYFTDMQKALEHRIAHLTYCDWNSLRCKAMNHLFNRLTVALWLARRPRRKAA